MTDSEMKRRYSHACRHVTGEERIHWTWLALAAVARANAVTGQHVVAALAGRQAGDVD